MIIEFFTKDNCSLCEEALGLLKLLEKEYPHVIKKRDITTNIDWLRKYRNHIPVLKINEDELRAEELTLQKLENFLAKHQGFT